MAEVRGLKATVYGMKPNEEGWTHARSCSAEKEQAAIADISMKKIKKRKPEGETNLCYGCGQIGLYIANFQIVIYFCCNDEGHRASEYPWNPKAKGTMPLVSGH